MHRIIEFKSLKKAHLSVRRRPLLDVLTVSPSEALVPNVVEKSINNAHSHNIHTHTYSFIVKVTYVFHKPLR